MLKAKKNAIVLIILLFMYYIIQTRIIKINIELIYFIIYDCLELNLTYTFFCYRSLQVQIMIDLHLQ